MIGSSRWAADYLTPPPDPARRTARPAPLRHRHRLGRASATNCSAAWPTMPATPSARWTSCAKRTTPRSSACWRRISPACRPSRRLADHLSELADIIVQETLRRCAGATLKNRHPRATPKFAVIGYGKLGGKELGYASDLDLVFLYDDPDPDAGEIYARLGQRLNTWLSSQTSAGMLFETDLRLRPNGDSGLLVSSIEAFREYQLEQGLGLGTSGADPRPLLRRRRRPSARRFEAIRMRNPAPAARPRQAARGSPRHAPEDARRHASNSETCSTSSTIPAA